MPIMITKASGVQEPFSEEKLRRSLQRTKISPKIIDDIVLSISRTLTPGISTHQIYQSAFNALKQHQYPSASKYQLKRSLMALGPEGHYFEQLIGRLLVAEGYEVSIATIVSGFCISHEVDVVAKKDTTHAFIECKFHNQVGIKTDVKVALYVRSRVEDIIKKCRVENPNADHNYQAWIVTNTALTSDAIHYAQCIGMNAIAWNYPPDNGLATRIAHAKLHPITALTTLSTPQKNHLLKMGVIVCQDLYDNPQFIRKLNLVQLSQLQLQDELRALCSS